VIVPGIASVFGIFLVRQFALGIPDELLDAARVDGASELRIYWTIVLPVMRRSSSRWRLHLPRRLERLHVAPDRADRRAQVHAAGGPRQPGRASTCRTPS
jgi:hypothetical protein